MADGGRYEGRMLLTLVLETLAAIYETEEYNGSGTASLLGLKERIVVNVDGMILEVRRAAVAMVVEV